jgi:hypothetical protein
MQSFGWHVISDNGGGSVNSYWVEAGKFYAVEFIQAGDSADVGRTDISGPKAISPQEEAAISRAIAKWELDASI